MPDKAPEDWRSATTSKHEAQFAITLGRIGERLAKDAGIVKAPLPERMAVLLIELRRRRADLHRRRSAGGRTKDLVR